MAVYTPHTKQDVAKMLKKLKLRSIDGLFGSIPAALKLKKLDLPSGVSQAEAEKALRALAAKNKQYDVILRGAGAYSHYIPPVVTSLASRSEFVTAYTPYQAELSQGILQSIFEYQSMLCRLTGLDVANASVYDGATAAAEAALMCKDRGRNKLLISGAIKPDVLSVLRTYTSHHGMEIVTLPLKDGATDLDSATPFIDERTCAVYLEQPNYYGVIEDCKAFGEAAHAKGAKLIMGVYPIALTTLKTPAECGADIAVGEGQPLGMSLNFGGPYLGYMVASKAMQRKLPGRIVGETVDRQGKRCYCLTLQAREQHIKREKASSNICSNQAHCALTAAIYLATQGTDGLTEVASRCISGAHYLQARLAEIGLNRLYGCEFFNEFVTACPVDAQLVLTALEKRGILGGLPLEGNRILWCVTENNDKAGLDRAVRIIGGAVKC